MHKFNWIAMILIGATALVACPQTVNKPFVNALTTENAWNGDVPENAKTISNDEFNQRFATGELQLVSTAQLEQQKADRQKQYQEDQTFLQGIANKSVPLQELLKQAAANPEFVGDQSATLPDGQKVVLQGVGTQLRSEVEAYKLSQSAENALAAYRLNYGSLSDAQKSKLPVPDGLQGKTLADVNAARDQLEQVLVLHPVKTARPEVSAKGAAANLSSKNLQAQGLSITNIKPGSGVDNNGPCAQPTNYYAKFWFPLKYFISPIKQQGRRGTCWAFADVGAIESRERVQNNNPIDLSEQYFVNKQKAIWKPDDVNDGNSPYDALNNAVDHNHDLPKEAIWTYNPAYSRPDMKKQADSCTSYSGTCSDTTHESEEIFNADKTHKGYVNAVFAGTGILASQPTQIWKNGDPFRLEAIKQYLAGGHVILTDFPVYKGFMDDVGDDGIVKHDDANYSAEQVHYDETKPTASLIGGSYGDHAVQIVGFLSNMDLFGSSSNNQYGGGYFIIKNSWGCSSGDGGYYYVPADYVSRFFFSMSVLNFDTRRSDAWNQEQAAPGGAIAPSVTSKNLTANLRVARDLSGAFTVSHPTAKSVNLLLTSDKDGVLYNGPWSTEAVFGGPGIPATFSSAGTRTISLEASYNGKMTKASFTVNVINTAPKIVLQFLGSPHQSEDFAIGATITDPNEADTSKLCATTTWSVDVPDGLSTTTGCQIKVKFGKTGSRQVRVQTRDSDGLSSGQTAVNFQVLAATTNPYPKIVSAGIVSLERTVDGSLLTKCGAVPVTNSTTIDLRQTGCSIFFGDAPPRFEGYVQVENPSNETLGYNWTLFLANAPELGGEYVAYTGDKAKFPLHPVGNASVVTRACRVELKVTAPDPARSKSLVAWQGQCITPIGTLN